MDNFDWDGECPYGYTADNYPSETEKKQPKMPPARKQAMNLAQAVGRAAKALIKKQKVLAEEKIREERIKICEGCEFLRGSRCSKCGCFTTKKIALATESCPEGKWAAASESQVRNKSRETILVWSKYFYREAQDKPLKNKIEATGFDYAFTQTDDIKGWVKDHGKPVALIRWEESAGVNGLRRPMKRLTRDCYELGIVPLYVDFGYFDHYKAYMFDWYARNGHASITQADIWEELPDDDSWRDQSGELGNYFQSIHAAYEKAAVQEPFAVGEYVLAFVQCTARRCRLPMKGTNSKSWLTELVGAVGRDRLVVKYPPSHGGLHQPEGVRVFTGKGRRIEGKSIVPPPGSRELNANLVQHAHAVVSNTSSVSNELLIRDIPMFMTGASWFSGLNVFDEPESWDEIANRKPVLGDKSCRNKFAHWWLQHREPFRETNNLLRNLVEQWRE